MAARILLEVGTLSSERVFVDQAKATATLLAFYGTLAPGDESATNQEKLDAILAYLVRHMIEAARDDYIARGRIGLRTEAAANYDVD